MSKQSIEQALDDAVSKLNSGVPVDQCAGHCPRQRNALLPLLDVAHALIECAAEAEASLKQACLDPTLIDWNRLLAESSAGDAEGRDG